MHRGRLYHQSSSLVIVSFYVVLCFADHRLCFLDCCLHPFHELINCLQTGGVLSGFKAHARKSFSVEQEQRLLSSGVDVIAMLKLYQR